MEGQPLACLGALGDLGVKNGLSCVRVKRQEERRPSEAAARVRESMGAGLHLDWRAFWRRCRGVLVIGAAVRESAAGRAQKQAERKH